MNELVIQKHNELFEIRKAFFSKMNVVDTNQDYPCVEETIEDKEKFNAELHQHIENLKKFMIDFYDSCCKEQNFDDFVTIFTIYCNYYIWYGLSCYTDNTAEETMFGLKKSDFIGSEEKTLLPYLEMIYQGIKTGDDTCFKKAENINPTFTVAHLYLFARNATLYFLSLEQADEFTCQLLSKLSKSELKKIKKLVFYQIPENEQVKENVDKIVSVTGNFLLNELDQYLDKESISLEEEQNFQSKMESYTQKLNKIASDFYTSCFKEKKMDDFIVFFAGYCNLLKRIISSTIPKIFDGWEYFSTTIRNIFDRTMYENSYLGLKITQFIHLKEEKFINYLAIIGRGINYWFWNLWFAEYWEEISEKQYMNLSAFESSRDFFVTSYYSNMIEQYKKISSSYQLHVLGGITHLLPYICLISPAEVQQNNSNLQRQKFNMTLISIIPENASTEINESDSPLEATVKLVNYLKTEGKEEELQKLNQESSTLNETLFPETFVPLPKEQQLESKNAQQRQHLLNLCRTVHFGNNRELLKHFFQINITLESEKTRREKLIDSFAHDMTHFTHPKLVHDVARELLKNGDEEHANTLLYAYNLDNLYKEKFLSLKQQYSSEANGILEIFRNGLRKSTAPKFTIEHLLDESLNLVLFRFLMEEVDTRIETIEVIEKLKSWLDIPALRQEYINLFIIQNNSEINIKSWFSKYFYPINIEETQNSKWNSVKFWKNKVLYAMFSGFFVNLFHNALNYGKKSHNEGWLRVRFDSTTIDTKNFLTIEFSNPIEIETAYEKGTGHGLAYLHETISNLNRCIYPERNKNYGIESKQENGIFYTTLFFAEDLLIRKK